MANALRDIGFARWIERPGLLAALTLAFALVPVGLALITYRDARQKDDRLYETTTQVLAEHLVRSFERHTYLPKDLRQRSRNLDDAGLASGKGLPTYPWKEKMPFLIAMGYAQWVDEKTIVQWKTEERESVAAIGENLTLIPGVAAAQEAVPHSDMSATFSIMLPRHRLLVMPVLAANPPQKDPRGFMLGWIDLDALCRDVTIPLLRDEVLVAAPLTEGEPLPEGARRMTIRENDAHWDVGIMRGPQFSHQFGPPTPWVLFIAVALSAVPLVILASLAGRSTKLRATLAAEREIMQQHRQFTQSVSHEFRTPLGIILSGADLLESYGEQLPPERVSEVLAEIKDNTGRMNEMVERLLLLGSIESSKLQCEREMVNVEALCREIARRNTTVNPGAVVVSVNAPDLDAMLDASLLDSVLGNLLSNAVKYSSPGAPVTLDAQVKNDWCIFTVRDEGIGIPNEDVARVFDPFHRCGNVGDRPGTGLGLAIAQRCAALHGGTLQIESTEGHGTLATVSISLS
jgi:signal transduction histidine kinase